jgi:hypothetical protein
LQCAFNFLRLDVEESFSDRLSSSSILLIIVVFDPKSQ